MSYDQHQLGWKAFQDLGCAVLAEELQRPVQTFLHSKDGGRDGAFLGTLAGDGGDTAKSTLQCKFISKPGASLGLSALKAELPKAEQLAAKGLADDYVILTNAGVSGASDAEICAAKPPTVLPDAVEFTDPSENTLSMVPVPVNTPTNPPAKTPPLTFPSAKELIMAPFITFPANPPV